MTAWDDEYTPPALVTLGQRIRAAFGLAPTAIGTKGNEEHTYGYHRSRRWILTDPGSDYGSDDYSVTSALDQGGDPNWISALDITPASVEQMITISKRVDAAMRADRLPAIREFYGNTNGDRIVDGWDDLTHRAATSDDSHLWHLHLSFYRSRAGDDHADVLAVLLGDPLEDDMALTEYELYGIIGGVVNGSTAAGYIDQTAPPWARAFGAFNLRALDAKLNKLLLAQGVAQADIDELQARPVGFTAEQVKELAAALAAEVDPAAIEATLVDVLGRVGFAVRPA